jgi:hypothetical protein
VRFQWNGSTWTTGVDDGPRLPIQTDDVDGGGELQRLYSGAARLYNRWQKKGWTLRWEYVGTSPYVYLSNMRSLSGTVELAFTDGTYQTYLTPGGLQREEVGYLTWNVTAQFVET